MNSRFSLLAGALLLGTLLPTAVQAQPACMIDSFGFAWDLVLDSSNDTFSGTVNVLSGDKLATAARGNDNRTIRHHVFTAVGEPGVDWFTYNGQIISGGPNYQFSGDWVNSIGNVGTVTGTIALGACNAPRLDAEPTPDSPNWAGSDHAASAAARAQADFHFTSAPNPFETGTVLSYTLPAASDVRVVVYDALGRQVSVLVDEEREAGTHTVSFDGASLPAGTYLFRLTAGTYSAVQRVALAR